MANVSINVKNLKDYQLKVLRAHNELRNFEERFLNTLALMVMTRAMKNTPVRTGTLRDSIGVEVKPDEKAAYIGTMADKFPDKPYGQYVELGARGRPGVHMLQRSASEHTDEYKQIMEDALKNA